MALDKVVDNILENARQEAQAKLQATEQERAKILLEADQSIEKRKKADEKELQDSLARMRRQELSSAELEAKKTVLNTRKEILDRTFNETLEDLNSLSDEERSAVYDLILADGRKVIPHPRVLCPKGDALLVSGISARETDMEPGLILESEDGTVRLDMRFRTILESTWERELKNVSNILFE